MAFEIVQGDCIPEGYVDADKLDKSIFNLLSNAFKYTAHGVRIQLSFHTEHLNGPTHLIVSVQDTGLGIAPSELDKIFIPFYNNRLARQQETNGIALGMSKDRVQLHHGTIVVDSIVGKGSTFFDRIPVEKEVDTAVDLRELNDSFIDSDKVVTE